MSGFGEPVYERRSRKTSFKLEDGSNVFRILPPYGSLQEKGKFIQYYSVVWGYKDSQGKKYPFSDYRVVNYKTRMVEVESPAYLKSKELSERYANALDRAKKGDKAITSAILQKLKEDSEQYNIDNKYYLNVMDLNGEVGLLKIGSRAKKQLDGLIKELHASDKNPVSLKNGVFFNFHRSGLGRDTQYTVTIHKEKKETKEYGIIEQTAISSIPDEDIPRILNSVYDLGTMYKVPTTEQLERIVAGEPVDVVLDGGARGDNEELSPEMKEEVVNEVLSNMTDSELNSLSEAITDMAKTPTLAPETKAETTTPAPEIKSPAPTPAPSANVDEMDDKEFLASLKALGL